MARQLAVAALLACLATAAAAQTVAPGAERSRHPMADRFAAADTNGDGRLRMAEAQAAHWHKVVDHFGAIDADHDGTITLAELRAWRDANRGAPAGSPLPPPAGQR